MCDANCVTRADYVKGTLSVAATAFPATNGVGIGSSIHKGNMINIFDVISM